MKRTLIMIAQLVLLGGLTLAGLLMTLKLIATVLKIFAFILGEWIYTALILFIGALFILIPVGYAVSVLLQHYENSKKEYENPGVREWKSRWGMDEEEEEQD